MRCDKCGNVKTQLLFSWVCDTCEPAESSSTPNSAGFLSGADKTTLDATYGWITLMTINGDEVRDPRVKVAVISVDSTDASCPPKHTLDLETITWPTATYDWGTIVGIALMSEEYYGVCLELKTILVPVHVRQGDQVRVHWGPVMP